ACNVQESSMTIGGCEINTGNSLVRLLNRFSQAYPNARMSMLTSPNANVPQLVKSSMIDLGFFFSIDGKNLPGLEMALLYREPVYLLTGRENPIFDRGSLRYEDLQDIAFAYPHDSCCFICELLSLLRRKGVALGKVTYLGNLLLVAEQIHKEHAVTLMPHTAVEHFCSTYDMRVIDLGGPVIWTWNTLVYKNFESLHPLARTLLHQSTEYARSLLREDSMLVGE
ncbi:MAG: LysR family transcriptional regulator substrate-binding protein, partial [Candidatus Ventricola sp.]|nr:LysR family transcriptional regulator substrate-binding protein [Candidatus Ventricola sp.]